MAADTRELDDLQRAARDVFADLASSADVHHVIDSAPGRDAALEAQLAELGFYSVLMPGTDGTLAHLLRIVTEAGAAMATTRLLGHAVGLGTALASCPASPRLDRGHADVAAGAFGTVVGLGAGADGFHHRTDSDGWLLDGAQSFALDADGSELVLVWSRGADGPILAAVDGSLLTVTPLATIDRSRVLSQVRAERVRITPEDVLASGDDADAIGNAVLLALELALAFDSVGIARRALDQTVDYARTREQFGRPIGSFQAVQHQAADMATRTELSRSTCDAALRDVLAGAADAPAAVAMARETACSAASWVAGRAIQLHGGIGYTWEHDAHIALKRAKLTEKLVTSAHGRRSVVLAALTTGAVS